MTPHLASSEQSTAVPSVSRCPAGVSRQPQRQHPCRAAAPRQTRCDRFESSSRGPTNQLPSLPLKPPAHCGPSGPSARHGPPSHCIAALSVAGRPMPRLPCRATQGMASYLGLPCVASPHCAWPSSLALLMPRSWCSASLRCGLGSALVLPPFDGVASSASQDGCHLRLRPSTMHRRLSLRPAARTSPLAYAPRLRLVPRLRSPSQARAGPPAAPRLRSSVVPPSIVS